MDRKTNPNKVDGGCGSIVCRFISIADGCRVNILTNFQSNRCWCGGGTKKWGRKTTNKRRNKRQETRTIEGMKWVWMMYNNIVFDFWSLDRLKTLLLVLDRGRKERRRWQAALGREWRRGNQIDWTHWKSRIQRKKTTGDLTKIRGVPPGLIL